MAQDNPLQIRAVRQNAVQRNWFPPRLCLTAWQGHCVAMYFLNAQALDLGR
jgi:hypothetical protein